MPPKKSIGASSGKRKGNTSKYSKKEVLQLKAVFDQEDTDESGEVSFSELAKSFQGSNLDGQADTLFQKLDVDGDGTLTFMEYMKLYYPYASKKDLEIMHAWACPKGPQRPPTPEATLSEDQLAEIREIFCLYDTNGDGVLERSELVNAMVATGYDEDEIEDLFDEYDKDGSNRVEYGEFCEMVKQSFVE